MPVDLEGVEEGRIEITGVDTEGLGVLELRTMDVDLEGVEEGRIEMTGVEEDIRAEEERMIDNEVAETAIEEEGVVVCEAVIKGVDAVEVVVVRGIASKALIALEMEPSTPFEIEANRAKSEVGHLDVKSSKKVWQACNRACNSPRIVSTALEPAAAIRGS